MTDADRSAAERYLADAAEAYRMAQIVKGREDKAAWLELAKRWSEAARRASDADRDKDMPALWL
jgi:hypothetical protein